MESAREVQKGFCILSVAYIVLGIVLLIWPDISVPTICYVVGIAMIIYGGAHLIMYFTRNKVSSVMQPDLVIGVVTIATGFYVLLKMEYMLEIIPFAMGIIALLGSIVKVQHALDLKRLASDKWFLMLIFAALLMIFGILLIANPFHEQAKLVIILIGIASLLDGIGNLLGIIWIGIVFKKLKKVENRKGKHSVHAPVYDTVDVIEVESIDDNTTSDSLPVVCAEDFSDRRTSEEES